jgi:hypothetical protein
MHMDSKTRRSFWNSIRVEEEFTNRQIYRVFTAASIYIVCATFLLCVFYVYVLHPSGIGKPSLLNFVADFRARWQSSPELGSALRVWLVSMGGMSALFAIATGMVVSKKLAGPIYRLKTDLTKMAETGEVKPIVLRENDELMDVADAVNAALAKLSMGSSTATEGRAGFDNEQLAAHVATMRAHVKRLDEVKQDADGLEGWATRMSDLLDKADPHHGA